MVIDYDAVINLNVDPSSWIVAQLKVILKPLKTNDDTTIASKKADLYTQYVECRGRTPKTIEQLGQDTAQKHRTAPLDEEEITPEERTGNNEETEDYIEVMLLLNNTGTEEPYQACMI